MAQLDALSLTDSIRDRLARFSGDDHYVRDPRLGEICRGIWSGVAEGGGLISRLWVELTPPPLSGGIGTSSLEGFDPELAAYLDRRGVVPGERPLYVHQEEAIRAAAPGPDGRLPAVVVTAGTGAGKTESFLLPLLNDLHGRPATTGEGVRALVLYPMNALVNDQVDRLHEWLLGQDRLTFIHMTSETPEDSRAADGKGYPRWDDASRMRTRQQARGREDRKGKPIPAGRRGPQPDILVTNYSMLEYMLSRPQDGVFFGPALRAIILDEAHLYTGTLAAEITLLLRRLLERCGLGPDRVLQIATSATIGTGDRDELAGFASDLFTKPRDLVRVVVGEKAPLSLPAVRPPDHPPSAGDVASAYWPTSATLVVDHGGRTRMAEDRAHCEALSRNLRLLVDGDVVDRASDESGWQPALLLHLALSHAPILHRAAEALAGSGRMTLEDLATVLWGADTVESRRATVALLRLGASARSEAGAYPLLPHRLHVLARPTDGLVACLDPDCPGDPARKPDGLGAIWPGHHDHCPECRAATLSLHRCSNCGTWGLAALAPSLRFAPVPGRAGKDNTVRYFLNAPRDGATPIQLDPRTGERKGSGRARLWEVKKDCPTCSAPLAEAWQPFASGAPLTLSILAETALAGLPEYPSPGNAWLPARGRRILAFSDSRQEAARLGPRLTLQHEVQLVRAAMARMLAHKPDVDDSLIEALRADLEALDRELGGDLSPSVRRHKQDRRDRTRGQLDEALGGSSLGAWVEELAREDLPARPILRELIDRAGASAHDPGAFGQRAWEENARVVSGEMLGRVGRELISPVRRAISLETIGLAEIVYPGLDGLEPDAGILALLPAVSRRPLGGAWVDFLASLCDSLRSDGAITLGNEALDRSYPFGANLIGRWCAEVADGYALIRFVGVKAEQRRRRFADAVLRRLGVEADREHTAQELLRGAFRQLHDAAGGRLAWLQAGQREQYDGPPVDAIRLVFPALGLRKPMQMYQCDQAGHLWPRSVLGCAPEIGCESLAPIDGDWRDALDGDPRVGRLRQEYQSSRVFETGLWAEEHSAQLAPEENRRLQDLFRVGARNILSSTTTLELGIDIGGLSAVLMGNVPPGKANYLQRAGRAGRRADGSSIVITFARPRPFDRAVFLRLGDFLGRPLRRPRIFLERERVVRRHAHALLLGEFFRAVYPPGTHVGAMNAFGYVGRFCGVEAPIRWRSGESKPDLPAFLPDWSIPPGVGWWVEETGRGLDDQFVNFLRWVARDGEGPMRPAFERLFRGSQALDRLADWGGFLGQILADFRQALSIWREDFNAILAAWRAIDVDSPGARGLANMLRYQLASLCDMTVIEALAERQFLPRYGFPIGVLQLRVIRADQDDSPRIREEDQYRLERRGLLALREYVPGSQLLVGGRLVTSRGILKHWTGANLDGAFGLQGKLATCEQGHEFYATAAGPGDELRCPICDSSPNQTPEDLLLPRHGFTTAAWDPPSLSSDAALVAEVERTTIAFAQPARPGFTEEASDDFGGIPGLVARYREDGELLVYNRGENRQGFAICTKCGYADSERAGVTSAAKGRDQLPSGFASHAPLSSPDPRRRCWGQGEQVNPLRRRILAAGETTDVLHIDLSPRLGAGTDAEAIAETLARALQNAGAGLLGLDTREIGSLVVPMGSDLVGIVLYDNVPGGAGHVLELFRLGREWLKASLETMYVDGAHHARCETACLDCLLTFDAQEAMQKGLLRRKLAYQILSDLLGSSAAPGTSPSA